MNRDERHNLDRCRVEFTLVSDDVKQLVKEIKLVTNDVLMSLGTLMDVQTDPQVRRLIALAMTEYDGACMWAVKAMTEEGFALVPLNKQELRLLILALRRALTSAEVNSRNVPDLTAKLQWYYDRGPNAKYER